MDCWRCCRRACVYLKNDRRGSGPFMEVTSDVCGFLTLRGSLLSYPLVQHGTWFPDPCSSRATPDLGACSPYLLATKTSFSTSRVIIYYVCESRHTVTDIQSSLFCKMCQRLNLTFFFYVDFCLLMFLLFIFEIVISLHYFSLPFLS